jgi:hypothetical protein
LLWFLPSRAVILELELGRLSKFAQTDFVAGGRGTCGQSRRSVLIQDMSVRVGFYRGINFFLRIPFECEFRLRCCI